MSFTPEDRLLALRLKALAHPVRLTILRALMSHAETVCCGDIVSRLPLAQSTVSEHLRVLCEAGLVTCDPMGTRCCYRPVPEAVAGLSRAIAGLDRAPAREARR